MKLRERFTTYYPSLFFVVLFLGAWIWRSAMLESPSLDLFLIFAAFVATLLNANQRLPWQNIVGLLVVISIFWLAAILIGKTFGVFISPPRFNFRFLREFESGFLWVIGLLNARGIAHLLLYSLRKNRNFGLWLIASSGCLLAVEDSRARNELIYLLEKFLFAGVFFVAATPWFLDKKRIERPPDFQPLLITILLLLW